MQGRSSHVGLEERLAEVSTKEELWDAVYDAITQLHPQVGKPAARLQRPEAEAFVAAGERVGYAVEELVTEYWRRANKDSLAPALDAARKSIGIGAHYLADVHAGYDLQHAIEQHLGWMRDANIEVPSAILNELAEHGRVLAYHAKANTSWGHQLMPTVEMFSSIMGEDKTLIEARVSTSKVRARHFFEGTFYSAADVAQGLNMLQRYEPNEGQFFDYVLACIGLMFITRNSVAVDLLRHWDWSGYQNEVYGKFVVAMSSPHLGQQGLFGTRRSVKDIFSSSFSVLSGKNKPSPEVARILLAELEYLASVDGERSEEPDAKAINFLEEVIGRELEHRGLRSALVNPQHLGTLLRLYRRFGGDTNSVLRESLQDYVMEGLLSRDVGEIAVLAGQIGLEASAQRRMYAQALDLVAGSAVNVAVHVYATRESIRQQKTFVGNLADRLARLSELLDDKTRINEQVEYALAALQSTRFGIGMHYLSSLVINYERAFKKSPLEILSFHTDPEELKRYFERELHANERAPISHEERGEIARLYEDAYGVLYGKPISPLNERKMPRNAPASQQVLPEPQRPIDNRVIVYIGDKKINGGDEETVKILRMGLEERTHDTKIEQGNVPGKGLLYGISMTRQDFVVAAQENLLPPIQAVYITGVIPDVIAKGGRFYLARENGGVFIETSPVPNTFAIHHVNALAMAFSDSSKQERNTAPHDRRRHQ